MTKLRWGKVKVNYHHTFSQVPFSFCICTPACLLLCQWVTLWWLYCCSGAKIEPFVLDSAPPNCVGIDLSGWCFGQESHLARAGASSRQGNQVPGPQAEQILANSKWRLIVMGLFQWIVSSWINCVNEWILANREEKKRNLVKKCCTKLSLVFYFYLEL